MKKTTFLKTLLMAVGLCMGTSAWADATCIYERGTTTVWSASDIGTGQWVKTISDKSYPCNAQIETEHNYGLYLPGQVRNQEVTYTISPTANALLTYDIVWFVGGTTGNNANNNYLKIGNNITIAAYFQSQQGKLTIGSTDHNIANACNRDNGNRTDDIWTIHIEINTATNNINSITIAGANGTKKAALTLSDQTLPFGTTYTTVAMGCARSAGSMYTGLKSITISEEEQELPTAEYTVNYIYNEEIIKTIEGEEPIGNTVYPEIPIYVNDVKYYATNEATTSMTIVDGTNILNIELRRANTWSYSIKSSLGTIISSSSGTEGESISYSYPRYVLQNTTLYQSHTQGTPYSGSFVLAEDNQEVTITYSATGITNVLAYIEGEDIAGATVNTSASNVGIRASGQAVANGTDVSIMSLPSADYQIGAYRFGVGQFMHRSNYSGTVTLNFGEQSYEWTSTTTNLAEQTSGEYVVAEGTELSFTTAEYGDLDYLYIIGVPANEIVGAVDYTTADRGATKDLATLNNGDVYKVTFQNHGSSAANKNNFLAYVKNGGDIVATMYSDWYDYFANSNTNFTNGYASSMDGGLTLPGSCWTNFFTDMANAQVELTFSYSGGTLSIAGTATNNSHIYYYNYAKSGLVGDVTVGLSVCKAWIEILSESSSAAVSGTLSSTGYSSLAVPYALNFSGATGLTAAYVVTKTTNEVAKLTSVDAVPAGTPVILKGSAGAAYSIPVIATADAPTTNYLSAAVVPTGIAANEAYILQSGELHLVTAASTVPAGKAYLLVSNVPAGARSLAFSFEDDETTGIRNLNVNLNANEVYDLQGRRVAQPVKGLYIVNGKKVVIK